MHLQSGMFWPFLTLMGALNPFVTGELRGEVRFPSCTPPRITVCAEPVSGGKLSCTATDARGHYRLRVSHGRYYVFARADEFLQSRAYFTRAVQCGLDIVCTDHAKIPVQVDAGQIATGVDPADWFGSATDDVTRKPRA